MWGAAPASALAVRSQRERESPNDSRTEQPHIETEPGTCIVGYLHADFVVPRKGRVGLGTSG